MKISIGNLCLLKKHLCVQVRANVSGMQLLFKLLHYNLLSILEQKLSSKLELNNIYSLLETLKVDSVLYVGTDSRKKLFGILYKIFVLENVF